MQRKNCAEITGRENGKKFKLVSSENKLKDEQNEQNNTTIEGLFLVRNINLYILHVTVTTQ